MRLVINTDGGARGNPGPAAVGASVCDPSGEELVAVSERLPNTTNNVAEYMAVIRGLEEALKLGATDVWLRTDSELLVRQVEGRYKVKAAHLKPLYQQIRNLSKNFESFKIDHVRREANVRADELVNIALDS